MTVLITGGHDHIESWIGNCLAEAELGFEPRISLDREAADGSWEAVTDE